MSKKFGDRKDGVKIRNIDGVHKFMYHLIPKRSECEVHMYKDIDVTNMVNYYEKISKDNENITYFHMFCTAIGKTIYNYPNINKFVVNGNYYNRNNVSIGFVAKKSFTDQDKECLTVINLDKNDNLQKVSQKIYKNVKNIRNNKENNTDDAVEIIGKLPKFLRSFVIWIFKRMDVYDLIPNSLIKDSIYHCTVLVSNLGSIKCDAIYHHLTNFGTNSIIITIGEVRKEVKVINEKKEIRYMCNFGVTIDERIGDGFYFAKAVNGLEYILNNPEILEEDLNVRMDIR